MEYSTSYRERTAAAPRAAVAAPRPRTPGELLFASVRGAVYRISEEECVFKVAESEDRHVMTFQVVQALGLCQQFATLAEHNARVRQFIPELSNRPQDVDRVLNALHERGLLMLADDFVTHLKSDEGRVLPVAPIEDVFGLLVRTADRPGQLATLLDSVRDNQRRYKTSYQVVVLDDSRDAENAKKNAEVVRAAGPRGLKASLLGADWQARFVESLVKAFPEHEPQIRYLLQRESDEDFTGGRVWNLAVLLTAGRRFLMLDDDIVCQARQMDGDAWHPLITERPPRAAYFVSAAEGASEAGEACDFDPMAEHGRLLGGVVADALGDKRVTPLVSDDLWGFGATSWMGLSGHSRIATTISGTYGDSASSSNSWVFVVSDQSRKRLWEHREDYERYCEGHYVCVNAERFSISPLVGMSPVGLDNRAIMPPTLPSHRNEDYLFNASLRYLYPDSVSISFPWALGHYRPAGRGQVHDARETAAGANLAQFLADLALSLRGEGLARTSDGRFQGLAQISLGLADNGDTVLLDRLEEHLLFIRSNYIQDLQSLLARNQDAPTYWMADVRRIIETNGRQLTQPNVPRLVDMPWDLDRDGVAGWLRERVGQYGKAVEIWPELWRHCRDNPAQLPE